MDTHETQSVGIWVARDVFSQVPTRHPIRDELDRVDGDTQEWGDVRMC
jgi:hypothetical protein